MGHFLKLTILHYLCYHRVSIAFCRKSIVMGLGKEKEKRIGVVLEALPNTLFRVELKEGQKIMLGYLSGKMRLHRIRVLIGDTVEIELDPYNEEKGKITRRL